MLDFAAPRRPRGRRSRSARERLGAPGRRSRGDVRERVRLRRPCRGADAVVHLAAKVGLGVDLSDIDDYVSSNDLGTAVTLRAAADAGVTRGPGQLHGRLRRGPLHLPRPRCRPRPPAGGGRLGAGASSHACPGCGRPLARASSARTPRSTPATRMPRRRSARSTSRPCGRGRPAGRRSRCGCTTSTDRGMPRVDAVCRGGRDLPVGPGPWRGRRGSSRTAASGVTSSTSTTSRTAFAAARATCRTPSVATLPRHAATAGVASGERRSTSAPESSAPSATCWRSRPHRRPGARRHRRLPARRRPPHHRLQRPGPRGAALDGVVTLREGLAGVTSG